MLEQMDEENSVTETLLGQHYSPGKRAKLSGYKLWLEYWAYFTHTALLVLCAFLFSLWLHARSECQKAVYSPANVAVEYHNDLTMFNGTLDYPSIYRGYPTAETDAAWRRISTDGK
ncbi:hypothetical protein GALMADRAFT_138627 [Galerina marginata CBS 339.88]|uniref:Uncharacterized protein n=1 Tax=Galerina marginata (strain CBS 339.88) TaxID=685588 RepID=A0A067T5D2_GALM3|nr:hypothetical protein GALMADRAFT_138627 [Galerina marginata CBS 339.88]